jgi:hypothetical protein
MNGTGSMPVAGAGDVKAAENVESLDDTLAVFGELLHCKAPAYFKGTRQHFKVRTRYILPQYDCNLLPATMFAERQPN